MEEEILILDGTYPLVTKHFKTEIHVNVLKHKETSILKKFGIFLVLFITIHEDVALL
jgi:hypothetical protein